MIFSDPSISDVLFYLRDAESCAQSGVEWDLKYLSSTVLSSNCFNFTAELLKNEAENEDACMWAS